MQVTSQFQVWLCDIFLSNLGNNMILYILILQKFGVKLLLKLERERVPCLTVLFLNLSTIIVSYDQSRACSINFYCSFFFRREFTSMEIFFMINSLESFGFPMEHMGANQLPFVFSNLRKISRIKVKTISHKDTLYLRIVHVCHKFP